MSILDEERISRMKTDRAATMAIAMAVAIAFIMLLVGTWAVAAVLLGVQLVYLLVRLINLSVDIRDQRMVFDEEPRRRRER